jgi:hypothetical protein
MVYVVGDGQWQSMPALCETKKEDEQPTGMANATATNLNTTVHTSNLSKYNNLN